MGKEKKRELYFHLGYGKKHGKRDSHLVKVRMKGVAPTLTTVSFMNLYLVEESEE